MNWQAVPWMKLALVGGGAAAAAIAAILPPDAVVFGVHLQHIVYALAGILAGWAKRAPGDVKAE